MSSSSNISHDNEENNSLDQIITKDNHPNSPKKDTPKSMSSYDLVPRSDTQENPSKLTSEVENINNPPLNKGSVRIDETFVSNTEESSGGRGYVSIEPYNDDDDDDLELRYDDDLDDGDEIINEDALLDESVELADDLIIEVQEEKNTIETRDQDIIPLENAEKTVNNSVLKEAKDIDNPSNTLGEEEKFNDLQDKLLQVGKEPENQKESSGQENNHNKCTIDENQKLIEIFEDVTAENDNKAHNTKDTDDKNTSTLSQDSSFEQITEHGLNEPDMMLEIPTQEFIEFSDEDNELEGNCLKLSPDIEDVIDLEDNILDMDEEKMKHIEVSVKRSVDVDMTVSADPKTNPDASQVIVLGYESYEDVNVDVADNTKNDTIRNSLSYEAEIAADIITKEMNNVDVEIFIKETEVIHEDNENTIEELSTSLENENEKETTSQLKLEDTADVIELSDDIVEIEEDSGSSSAESLPDQKTKIENTIKSVELDEDILNEAEEIDNLILTSKISKTKLREEDAKVSDNPYKTSTRTCEKSKSKQNTYVNVKTSIEKANKLETEPDGIVAVEISDEISISTTAKKMDNITSDELVKEEGMTEDVSYQNVLSPDKMQITLVRKAEVCRSEQDTTIGIKPVSQPDNQLLTIIDSNSPQEISSKLNMADLSLVAHSESIHKQNTSSERESHISKSPELEKLTTEPNTSKIDDPSASNIDTSEINDCKNETESNSDDLNSSALKLEVIAENPSQDNQEFVSVMEESMDIDVIEQSKPINVMENSETGKPKLSSSNSEPLTSESVIPQSSLSKIEPKLTEICELTLSTSNTELSTSETDEMTPSLQKIELIMSGTVESTLSLSKIEPIMTETCEPMTIASSEQITESCQQTPSTSNLESITSETVASTTTSTIEPKIIEDFDPNPQSSALNVENISIEVCEPTPSTSKLEPTISETVDPTPFSSKPTKSEKVDPRTSTSKTEPIEILAFSSNIDGKTEILEPQPSSSMSELKRSESMEPQLSTSKCDTEEMDSKPSSPKNQPGFDSLVQDSSNDVTEMTDSLGLLAESSRVMEDDEEHEDDDDDGEDEDDSEPDDESSNQLTAEHSEDSNAHHSESDGPKDLETPNEEKQEFDFNISESNIVKEKELEKMECDEGKVEESSDETVKPGKSEAPDANKPSNDNETKAVDVETVKLLDSSDTVDTGRKEGETPRNSTDSDYTAKTKKLSITKQESVSMSYVDLEESSSDEDKIQPQTKTSAVEAKESEQEIATEDISSDVPQNEPTEVVKETETSGSESPKPAPEKDEVKPKEPEVVAKSTPSKVDIPQERSSETKVRSPMGLEVFSLDSDEEDSSVKQGTDNKVVAEKPPPQQPKARGSLKCINRFCTNTDPGVGYYVADTSTAMYFDADKSKRAYVCQKCSDIVEKRNQELIESMRNFTPLYQLHTTKNSEVLVEISDSDSDEEPEPSLEQMQLVGSDGAKMLEEQLEDMINETWEKFKMDDRLEETKNDLQKEIENLQKECREIDAMFNECEAATDKLRNSLYATFEPDIQKLPAIIIFDKPNCSYSCLEPPSFERNPEAKKYLPQHRQKRALSPSKDNSEPPPAKKPATPAPDPAPAPAHALPEVVVETVPHAEQEAKATSEKIDDDNMEVSVVTLATEAAPADLPPPGDLSHPPVKVGMTVYAMKNAFGTWLRAKVVEIQPKTHNMAFTMVRVRFEHKVSKNPFKTLPARCLAYFEPSEVRMTIGTRVIALFKDISARQAYYSGIVAEIPNPVNKYRYLIFFDDGYAQYAPHSQTRLVCEFSSLVWEEVHPYSREFVRSYLLAYPERPMVRLHAGQNLKTEWRGKWWSSRVVSVDSSLVEVQFLRCDRREWIYRGSTRLAPLYLELQAAERHRPRALPRTQPQARINMPYVEYTRSDEQANKEAQAQQRQQLLQQQQNEEIRRQRAVAKKSTALPQPPPPQPNSANLDNVTSRVVYYTPKNAVKPHKMVPHTCSPKCKRTDVLALKDLRTYNPLAKPLLSGWERQIVRCRGHKAVMYVAPCGRRLRAMRELHRYLRATEADMPVDLFDFSPATHCLAEFVLNKCFVGKKDLSHGKEIVPVPCVNYYDDSLPEFCSYNTERTPTAGVPLNLDPEFLCGCDCEDDCEDKTKCACWKMTLEGARTIGYEGDVGYEYRRLPEPLPSGIYECNSRCKCKNTCLNRVAQHPLQLKLQVFKTLNRGWGIRALNDVPKGAFLCIYAGNLLTDATANLDGLNEGDEYLAELDYIEVVEQMKEGYEEDIPDKIKAKDKKALAKETEEEEESSSSSSSSEEETTVNKNEREDGDFQPGYIGPGVAEFNKRLRRRDSKKEAEESKQQEKEKEANADEDCITISDDEEVREPSCFTAAAGMGKNTFISKYRSVRTLFGEDEACYIMDAKVQGNIGRYLNHSCTPNVFVQNVFVDTHDPRFPWVAFFALHHIRAGTELTWNYNYDVGSVPGKVLYCFCGAPNCRGRLL